MKKSSGKILVISISAFMVCGVIAERLNAQTGSNSGPRVLKQWGGCPDSQKTVQDPFAGGTQEVARGWNECNQADNPYEAMLKQYAEEMGYSLEEARQHFEPQSHSYQIEGTESEKPIEHIYE